MKESLSESQPQPIAPKEKERSLLFLRNHRFIHRVLNVAFNIAAIAIAVSTADGREMLRDPYRRTFFYNRERRVGLLEDSILMPSLHFPNIDRTSLEYQSAEAGRWMAYDFRRPSEFPAVKSRSERQVFKGRLGVFPLSSVIMNPPDHYTPTSLLNIFDPEHILQIEFPSLEALLKYGMIRETTYRQAFARVGLFERYRTFLGLSNLSDQPVYAVTPKGNTLVVVFREGGDKARHPKEVTQSHPAFAPSLS